MTKIIMQVEYIADCLAGRSGIGLAKMGLTRAQYEAKS